MQILRVQLSTSPLATHCSSQQTSPSRFAHARTSTPTASTLAPLPIWQCTTRNWRRRRLPPSTARSPQLLLVQNICCGSTWPLHLLSMWLCSSLLFIMSVQHRRTCCLVANCLQERPKGPRGPVDAAAAGRNLPAPLAFFPLTGEHSVMQRLRLLVGIPRGSHYRTSWGICPDGKVPVERQDVVVLDSVNAVQTAQ